jgi:hypothetical protein
MCDQLAENSTSPWQIADAVPSVVIDAGGDEPLELGPRLVRDPERCVSRSRQLAGGLEHPPQYHLEVELGQDVARKPNRIQRIGGIS